MAVPKVLACQNDSLIKKEDALRQTSNKSYFCPSR